MRPAADEPLNLTTTSLRIDRTLLDRFRDTLDEGRSMNSTLVEWIDQWTRERRLPGGASLRPASEDQLVELLVDNVAQRLKNESSWARAVIRRTQRPGDVLQNRMTHYTMEKQYLTESFSHWLSRRIEHYLDEEKEDVYLLLDAGSTILWFCRSLWEHLESISQTTRDRRVVIVTNNFPVAEAYAAQCQLERFSPKTEISCQLLGGTVQTRYAALVGPATQDSLQSFADRQKRPGKYIALVAGNFIRLSENERPAYPIPLIRGEGQKEIKELYIGLSNEAFVLASLGKIFLTRNEAINEALDLRDGHRDPSQQPYKDVQIDERTRRRVKLVTTLRTWNASILERHSRSVALLLSHQADCVISPASEIEQLSHFCFDFNDHIKGKSQEDQVRIEFPHQATQAPEFRKKFFDAA